MSGQPQSQSPSQPQSSHSSPGSPVWDPSHQGTGAPAWSMQASARGAWAAGGVMFAGVLMLVNGVLHVLQGIAAVARDDVYARIGSYTYEINLTGWGWLLLISGATTGSQPRRSNSAHTLRNTDRGANGTSEPLRS